MSFFRQKKSDDSLVELYSRRSRMWRAIAIVISLPILLLLFTGGTDGDSFASQILKKNLDTHCVAKILVDTEIDIDDVRERLISSLGDNPNVDAVMVYIDSPGGTIVGSDRLYRGLRAVAQRKPVVAVMGNVAASGGYLAAIAADHIIANPGTITGSIGVIMQYVGFSKIAEKAGIDFKSIKSAELKGMMSPYEGLSDNAENAVQSVIDDTYSYFLDIVAERRNIQDRKELLRIADGRIYTGRQALKLGLVDELGGEELAISWLKAHGVSSAIRKLPDPDTFTGILSFLKNSIRSITSSLDSRLCGILAIWQ